MSIKWFQISGVMFGSDNMTRMHKALKFFCDENKSLIADLDYLFITGDLGLGSDAKDNKINIIKFLQEVVGVKKSETFVVPGERDITYDNDRELQVRDYLEKYTKKNNEIIKNTLKKDKDFLGIQKEVSSNLCKDVKNIFVKDKANIVCLNTSVLAIKDKDGAMIKLALDYDDILDIEDNGKPVIVVAHHDFEYLTKEDQTSLESLLKESNVRLYLCGHGEKCDFYPIDTQKESRSLFEVHCGSGNVEKDNLYFSIGEMTDDGKRGKIKFYKLSNGNNVWLPYTELYRIKGLTNQDYVDFDINKQKREDSLSIIIKTYLDKLYEQCQGNCMGGISYGQPILLQKVRITTKFVLDSSISKRINEKSEDKNEADVLLKMLEKDNLNFYIGAELGGGKTTLVENLALKAVENWEKKVSELFPVRIQCRYIKNPRMKIPDVIQEYIKYQFLEKYPDKDAIELFICHINEKIDNNKVLLLFDGLDEVVEDSVREIFFKNLELYIKEKQLGHVVVSSRIEGYKNTHDVAVSFEKLVIAQWEKEDIIKFCTSWCNETNINQKKREEIINSIINKNSIFKLASNPLLLTSMLMSKKNRGMFPEKRSEVYKNAIEMFIEKWNSDWHEKWDLGATLILLSYIAFYMTFIKRQSSTIGRTDLKEKLLEATKYVNELAELKASKSKDWIEKFLKCAEQSSGILIERGIQTNKKGEEEPLYIFPHQGFQAYLAAYALVHGIYRERSTCDSIDVLERHNVFEKTKTSETIIIISELNADLGKKIVDELYAKIDYIDKNCVYPDVSFSHLKYYKSLIIQLILDDVRLTQEQRKDIYELVFEKISAVQIMDIKKLTISTLKGEFGHFVEEKKNDFMNGKVSYDLPIMYEVCKKNYGGSAIFQEYERLTKSSKLKEQKLAMMYADVGIMLSTVGYNFVEHIETNVAQEQLINDLFEKVKSRDLVVAGAAAAALTCFICVIGGGESIRKRLSNSPELIRNIIKAAVATNSIYIMVLCRYFDIQSNVVQEICKNQPQEAKDWMLQAYRNSRGHSQKIGSFWMCVICGLWTKKESEQRFREIITIKKISKNERNELVTMWKKYTEDRA